MAKSKKTNRGRQPARSNNKPPATQQRATWQVIEQEAAKRAERAAQPSLLTLNNDNVGEIAWRAHEQPRSTVKIPTELLLVVDGREQEYDIIARAHGAFVFPRNDMNDGVFGIWGFVDQVQATQQALNAWITRERISKNVASDKFGVLRSFTPQQRERAQRRWYKDVCRHRFRQAPPPGTAFKAIGVFTWPNSVDMDQALGKNLEVLDPVRMDHTCHIIRQDDSKHNIQVLGDADNVEQAVLRIRHIYFQLAARQYKATRQYRTDNIGDHVVLHDYNHTQRLELAKYGHPRPPGKVYRNSDWLYNAGETSKEQGKTTLNEMMSIIKQVHYLRARIQFSIRSGMFLAVQHMEPIDGSYEQDDFQTMIMQTQFIGETTEEMGDRTVENRVLQCLQQSKDFLLPHSVKESDLTEVRPSYEAIFTFSEEAQDLQLTMTWEDSVLSSRRWSKVGDTHLVDINLLNLNHGTAWHFDMRSSQSIDKSKIPTALINFADRVKFDPRAAYKFDPKVSFIAMIPSQSLRSLRLQSIHRYQYQTSEYTLEVRRFQQRDYTHSSIATQPTVTTYEQRVALSVVNPRWAKMLVENDSLGIGRRTKSSDRTSDWFPAYDAAGQATGSDEGLAQLLNLLRLTEAVVRSEEPHVDEHTGMAIG